MKDLDLKHFHDEVPDPYWSGSEGFDQVYQQIDAACEIIAKNIQNSTTNF
jgi:protein-tyrosine phosphatase